MLGFDDRLYNVKCIYFAALGEPQTGMIIRVLYLNQKLLVMIGRRWHTQDLADDADTDIDLFIEIGDLVVDDVETRVAKVGMS